MENLKKMIGDHTYVVVDHESNRFNFCGLIEITPELAEMSEHAIAWDLTEDLPEDVQRAIEVMEDNDVELEDFTGIIRFERDADTYYLLVWEQE
jgi:hypothetical protein